MKSLCSLVTIAFVAGFSPAQADPSTQNPEVPAAAPSAAAPAPAAAVPAAETRAKVEAPALAASAKSAAGKPAGEAPSKAAEAPKGPPHVPLKLELPEAVKAPWPPAEPTESHPEAISIVTGDAEHWEYAHGRAYIHAPIAKVFAALKDTEVLVDRRRLKEWPSSKESDAPTGGTSVVAHYLVKAVVPVKFDMNWRVGVLQGSATAPTMVGVSGEKIAGTQFLKLLNDWVIARQLTANVTSLEFVNHVKGLQVGKKDAEQAQKDLFESVKAKVHGKPLPKYL